MSNEIFNFAESMQKNNEIKKPSKEEVLKYANDTYETFKKHTTLNKEDYIQEVLSAYDKMSSMDGDSYFAHVQHMQTRNKKLLLDLQQFTDKKIEEVRRIREEREKKKLINRIKSFFKGLGKR